MFTLRNIHENSTGGYRIEKTIYGNKIIYGIYKTIDEVKEQIKVLEDNDWIKSAITGYSKDDSFNQYEVISLTNGKYSVIDSSNNNEYGVYNNKKYAKIIAEILPYYENNINLKKVQEYATKEFYKYITFEKSGRYRIRVSNINTSRCKTIKDALEERDLLLKYKNSINDEYDEELLCNLSTLENNEYEGSLPLPPWKNRHTNINKRDKGYYIIKTVGKKIILGPFKTEFVCKQILEFLNRHNWDKKSVRKIKKVTLDVHKPDRNIIKHNGKYEIIHTRNRKREVYYTSNDLMKTRFIRNKLEEKSWNIHNIKSHEKDYEKNRNKRKILNI